MGNAGNERALQLVEPLQFFIGLPQFRRFLSQIRDEALLTDHPIQFRHHLVDGEGLVCSPAPLHPMTSVIRIGKLHGSHTKLI